MLICPRCEAEYENGKFCPDCGEQLQRKIEDGVCPNCGASYEGSRKFCSECGSPLDKSALDIRYAKKLIDEEKYGEAIELFTNLAESGNSEAQYYLGACFLDGIGIDVNYIEAIKWLRLAAQQKNEEALELLRNLPNSILIKTKSNFSFRGSAGEDGTLLLYTNRIVFNGPVNNFVISIKDIRNIESENYAIVSSAKMIIIDNYYEYHFSVIDHEAFQTGVAAAIFGALSGGSAGALSAGAEVTTQSTSSQEIISTWIETLNKLIDLNKVYPNSVGIPNGPPELKKVGLFKYIRNLNS